MPKFILDGIEYGGGDPSIEITQAEYNMLVQTNSIEPNITYYIKDSVEECNASMIDYDNTESELEATDVQAAINEVNSKAQSAISELNSNLNNCFQSVSDGKALVASAITDKGVTTASDATFATMATNITNIQSGGGLPDTITAGNTPVLCSSTMAHTCTSTSATATGISITVPKTGTYRFKFSCARTNTTGTWTAQLYKNGSAISGATATWSSYQGSYSGDIACNANDVIQIYATSRGTNYRLITGQLVACIDYDMGF